MARYTYKELLEIQEHLTNAYYELSKAIDVTCREGRHLSKDNASQMRKIRRELSVMRVRVTDAANDAGYLRMEDDAWRVSTSEL